MAGTRAAAGAAAVPTTAAMVAVLTTAVAMTQTMAAVDHPQDHPPFSYTHPTTTIPFPHSPIMPYPPSPSIILVYFVVN
jgi:hypothetical protein